MSVEASEAVRIITGMVFRPGWELSAQVLKPRAAWPGEAYVHAQATVPTVDTSVISAEGEYTRPYTLHFDLVINVTPMRDAADLARALLTEFARFQEHEDREFLRYWDGTRWVAPLHPHTPEGQLAWSRR